MPTLPAATTPVARISLLAALIALAGPAQPLRAQEEAAVFRSDSRLVVLHATVLDQNGQLVTDLPKNLFRVYENGIEQQLKVFRREDAPVSLGLVVDDSGSMIDKRERVAAAALALIEASHPEDETFIVHFNDRAYLDTGFTNDIERLKRGLRTFDSRGTTAMRDALRLSIEHMSRAREDKKVLVLITDGEDNSSSVSRDWVVKAAQQAGVLVYAIGLPDDVRTDRSQHAKRELGALARATGGLAYFLRDVSEVGGIAREIAVIIRNQYTLAYTPVEEQLDGSYRRIHVSVDTQMPVTVLSRAGYWASTGTTARATAPEPGSR